MRTLIASIIVIGAATTSLADAGTFATFETGFDVFAVAANTPSLSIELDSTTASQGKQSLKLTRTADAGIPMIVRDDLALVGEFRGANTSFQFDAMALAGRDVPAGSFYQILPIYNTETHYEQGPALTITLDGNWHTYSWSGFTPPDANVSVYRFYLATNNPDPFTIMHIDNLRTVPEPSTVVIGGTLYAVFVRRLNPRKNPRTCSATVTLA